ncbi:MAG: hypothetical protein WBQ44_21790 [Rhodococcus sp. (in: high G+C Gram-positive bacteria)]
MESVARTALLTHGCAAPKAPRTPVTDRARLLGHERLFQLRNKAASFAGPAGGSIFVDTVYGFAVLAASEHPKRFGVPSDQDFTAILDNPAAAVPL